MIVRATLHDLDKLMRWRKAVLSEVFAGDEISEFLLAANRKYYELSLNESAHIACFALEGELTVGCGGMCLQLEMPSPDNPSGITGYLMNIYVSPGFRGRGHAHEIVKWLISRAKELGAGKIMLESTAIARKLYQSFGFKDAEGYMVLS